MIEHELNQYKLKCAMYEDKLKKLEEEKVCLLESLRILSTAPSTCPKVSTKCVIDDDHQESPAGGSNTMNANHERSTQGKRSKNSPNGTTQKNSRSSKSAASLQSLLWQKGVQLTHLKKPQLGSTILPAQKENLSQLFAATA